MKKIVLLILLVFFLLFTLTAQENITAVEKEIKSILNKVSPSIVKVVSENHKKYVATGIAIEGDLVLTSTLITRHRYERIFVKTTGNKEYPASVVGKDYRTSMILLKLDKKVLKPINRATKLEVGDWIAWIGVFYNSFPSIFQGIVSSMSDDELILNAPVAPGASGGAVVNKKGELAAVVRGRFGFSFARDFLIRSHESEIHLLGEQSKNKNLCYAIPINKVVRIVSQLKKHGKVKRGWLGVYMTSGKKDNNVIITSVVKKSPAEIAGIKKDDIIVEINGEKIKRSLDVANKVRSLAPDEVVKVKVQRGKKVDTLLVKIGEYKEKTATRFGEVRISVPERILNREMPPLPEFSTKLPKRQKYVYYIKGSKKLGIDIMEITPELAVKFKVKDGYGLMISRIGRGSAAEKGGLKVGDIIVKANAKRIKTSSDIRFSLTALKDKEALAIELYRDGKSKHFKIVPVVVKKVGFDWDKFRNQMKNLSINVYKHRDSERKLREQMEKLKHQLKERQRMSRYLSEEQRRQLDEEIKLLEIEYKRLYEEELKKLSSEKVRIIEEDRRMAEELKKIEELKKFKELEERRKIEAEKKKRMEEKKKKEKEKSDTTTI